MTEEEYVRTVTDQIHCQKVRPYVEKNCAIIWKIRRMPF